MGRQVPLNQAIEELGMFLLEGEYELEEFVEEMVTIFEQVWGQAYLKGYDDSDKNNLKIMEKMIKDIYLNKN